MNTSKVRKRVRICLHAEFCVTKTLRGGHPKRSEAMEPTARATVIIGTRLVKVAQPSSCHTRKAGERSGLSPLVKGDVNTAHNDCTLAVTCDGPKVYAPTPTLPRHRVLVRVALHKRWLASGELRKQLEQVCPTPLFLPCRQQARLILRLDTAPASRAVGKHVLRVVRAHRPVSMGHSRSRCDGEQGGRRRLRGHDFTSSR